MEDPALNRRIEETRELQMRWSHFHDFFTMALKGEQITPEAEKSFLDLKTRICMLHDGFMQSLKHDHKVGQGVLGILGQCILLRRIPLLSNAEVQKLELDWNEAYMLMNETIAGLEEERQDLANVNEGAYRMKKMQERAAAQMHNILMSPLFRAIFFFGVIPIFVIIGVPVLGIYNYRNIKRDVPALAPYQEKLEKWLRDNLIADLEFESLAQVPRGVSMATTHETSSNKNLNQDYLISQLINMGFSTDNLEEARAHIRGLAGFEADRRIMKGTRKPLLAFYLVFSTTENAEHFIELRRQGMATYDAESQAKVDNLFVVYRKANFVVIAASEEPVLKHDYIKEIWFLTDEDIVQ